jgi:cell division inhibitor SepF
MVRKALEYFGILGPDAGFAPARNERQVAAPRQQQPARQAPVTMIRPQVRSSRHDVGYSTIHTIRPRRYADDAENIAETFRMGSPVIIDLSQMNESEVRRLIDFMSGLVKGLEGTIRRVAAKVFMLTPAGIQQWDDEIDQASLSDGFDDLAV